MRKMPYIANAKGKDADHFVQSHRLIVVYIGVGRFRILGGAKV